MWACIERLRALGPGPHDVLLPKTVRAPEGVTYGAIEGPLGITGCLLASVGDKLPWRLKIRSASFANAQAMATALVGTPYRPAGRRRDVVLLRRGRHRPLARSAASRPRS